MSLDQQCRVALRQPAWEQMMVWLRVNMVRNQIVKNLDLQEKML